jgi:hypothetical protein
MRVALSFWLMAASMRFSAAFVTVLRTSSGISVPFHSIFSILPTFLRSSSCIETSSPIPFWAILSASTIIFLGHFEGAALDHHDRVGRAGDDHVHIGELERLEGRVEHPLPFHAAHADAGDRARPRDLARAERERGRDQAEDVVVILLVGGEDVDDDLDFVLEAFREERPDGAVDDAAGEDLLVARAPFALDEAAGDLARGVGLFLVLDGEREEGQRALLVAHGDGGEDDGFAVGHERGPGGLLGHAPGLDDEGAAREGPLNAMHHMSVL